MLARRRAAGKTLPEIQKFKGWQGLNRGSNLSNKRPAQSCRAFIFPVAWGEANTLSAAQKQAGIPTGVYNLIILGSSGFAHASL